MNYHDTAETKALMIDVTTMVVNRLVLAKSMTTSTTTGKYVSWRWRNDETLLGHVPDKQKLWWNTLG
jgi:hypothetical protein